MGLTHLASAEMVQLTGRWLGEQRDLFLSVSEIHALIPRVEQAHQRLLQIASQAAVSPMPGDLEVLDDRHDHLLRAAYYLHRAYCEYELGQTSIDTSQVQRIKESFKALLPRGLLGTKAGYVAEAANAKMAKQAFDSTPSAQKVVGELRLSATVTGRQLVEQWWAAAAELGAAAQAKATTVPDTDPEQGLKHLRARNAWIAIVRTVLTVLEHTTAAVDKVAALRNPVDEAEAKATVRAMARRNAGKTSTQESTGPTG